MFASFPQEPASALAGQPTAKQSTAGGRTRPSTAATAQHYSNITTPTSQRKRRRTKAGSSLPPLGLP